MRSLCSHTHSSVLAFLPAVGMAHWEIPVFLTREGMVYFDCVTKTAYFPLGPTPLVPAASLLHMFQAGECPLGQPFYVLEHAAYSWQEGKGVEIVVLFRKAQVI